jgi:hypothetical protein
MEVYNQRGPTPLVPDATVPSHKDNVTVVVKKLNWVPINISD